MAESDKTLPCKDCGETFTLTVEQQKFYADRGLHEPKRCERCRAAKRAERERR